MLTVSRRMSILLNAKAVWRHFATGAQPRDRHHASLRMGIAQRRSVCVAALRGGQAISSCRASAYARQFAPAALRRQADSARPPRAARWALGVGSRESIQAYPQVVRKPPGAGLLDGAGAGRPGTLERGASPRSRNAGGAILAASPVPAIRVVRPTTGASVRLADGVLTIPTRRGDERSERPSAGRVPASRKRAPDGQCRHRPNSPAGRRGSPARPRYGARVWTRYSLVCVRR